MIKACTFLFEERQTSTASSGSAPLIAVIFGLVHSLHLSGLNETVRPPTGTAELRVWAAAAVHRHRPRAVTSRIAAGFGKYISAAQIVSLSALSASQQSTDRFAI